MTRAYPSHREADVALRDGSTVHVRPVRAEDEQGLLEFLRSLSLQSLTMRFFSPAISLDIAARRETQVDYVRSFGLVATVGDNGRIVGHGMYEALDAERAEVSVVVADDYQGRGLGTLLLGQLAEAAADNGIRVFVAAVLAENHRMLSVLRQLGFPLEVHSQPGELEVTFPTSLSPEALERFERREQVAAANCLRTFLSPRAVAVIGASRQRGTPGGAVFHNLLAAEFAGPVYPVNPAAQSVQGVLAYPSVEAVPGPVDLAVVAVPAARVVEVARQCARKGVRALVVLSAGFAESGEEGRERQAELLQVCRAAGMRLIGPNCIGIANTDPEVRLNATFGPVAPPPGEVGFASQSGALGLAAIQYAAELGLGISSFVSMGNKADISGNDLLNYWESDPRTRVILLYLESFGNPRKFSRIARRVGRHKPIVAVKSGRSAAGARASSSHTGALLAASDVTVDALFRQSGVIRTDKLEELFDVASLLATQPLPRGRGVGLVTNVGGPAILCADALEAEGLEIPVLAAETQARLREFLPAEASVANPVDMLAGATAEQFRRAVALTAADPGVHSVIALFIRPLETRAEDVAEALVEAARELPEGVPLLAVFMAAPEARARLRRGEVRVPAFAFPEAAARALAHAVRYAEWRARPPAEPPRFEGVRRDEAAAVVSAALRRGGGWLSPDEVAHLLECYGLPLVEQRTVESPEAAAAAAVELGGEVALKAVAPGVVHKTEAGAVRLGLRGADEVAAAAREMAAALAAAGYPPRGFVVQRMVPKGVEMLVGIVHDPHFGPVVACGAGGVLVELLKDVSIRLAPLSQPDAAEMVRELKSAPLLQGYRGGPRYDVAALEEALLRVSAMAEDLPQLAELDLNPLVVLERGAAIVDARARVEPSAPPRPLGARR